MGTSKYEAKRKKRTSKKKKTITMVAILKVVTLAITSWIASPSNMSSNEENAPHVDSSILVSSNRLGSARSDLSDGGDASLSNEGSMYISALPFPLDRVVPLVGARAPRGLSEI